MVQNLNIDALARDLVRLLGDLTGLHGAMAAQLQEQLEAMRKADAGAIHSITGRQTRLAERVTEREGLRRQITRRLLEAIRGDGRRADAIRLSELAELLPEPRRSQLLTAATGLRAAVEELQRLQRTHALVTQEVLKHLGHVVAVMCGSAAPEESYSRGGRQARSASACVFEAVG